MSICRSTCASGSPRGRKQKAISSSRSTSIRRAFCKDGPLHRHCEERSDEAIQLPDAAKLDCFASLAMTKQKSLPSFATAGFPECAEFPAALRYATLTKMVGSE